MNGATQAQCVECGAIFAVDDMIRYSRNYVCASCKPTFMQKLSEGVRVGVAPMQYAGFWIRFAATMLDGVVFIILFMLIFTIALAAGLTDKSPAAFVLGAQMAMIFVGIGYEVFFIGRFGRTLGKMICGIKVLSDDGQPISYLRALARYFAKQLSGIILAVGYIMAAFDEEKRGLHDRICDTRVILVR